MPPSQARAFSLPSQDPAAEPALAVETERLRQLLRQQPPDLLALRSGAVYSARDEGGATLTLELWGAPVVLDFPALIARGGSATGPALPLPLQALFMYHLTTSDGLAPVGEWVSFADLPGGRMYAQAFQGYSGSLLTRAFGEDGNAFRRACTAAGGRLVELGDAAFAFAGLPRVPLLVTYWQGEEEFPSTSKILFDPTATHHLPIDVCAILGSMLVAKILKSRPGG
jgi:hypothetical protein